MKKLLLVLPLIAAGVPAHAAVPPEVRDQCMKAADFLGCVKAMTGALDAPPASGSVMRIDQTNRPGLLSEMGNSCPGGWAYSGAGKCRSTKCQPMGIFGKNEPALAGKGITCSGKNIEYGVLAGRASLRWGDKFENASIDPKCPPFEPDYGDPNSCVTAYRTGKAISTGIVVKPELGSFVVQKCLGQCAATGADISPGDKIVSRDGVPVANLTKGILKEGQMYTFKVDRHGREHTVRLRAQVMQYDGWIHPNFKKDTIKGTKKRTTARSSRDEFILD